MGSVWRVELLGQRPPGSEAKDTRQDMSPTLRRPLKEKRASPRRRQLFSAVLPGPCTLPSLSSPPPPAHHEAPTRPRQQQQQDPHPPHPHPHQNKSLC